MAQENEQKIKVRNIWASNLIIECNHIKDNVESYSFVSIKCKYLLHSTTVFVNKYLEIAPGVVYDLVKINIGNLPIIQLGLTIFNSSQELPIIKGHPTIWLFHFNMSDSHYCPKTLCEESLDMLELGGIDFEKNQKEGVDPVTFREIMIQLGFLQKVNTWISFVALYDFGYLVKLFLGKNRYPETAEEFFEKARSLLGEVLYDVQEMAQLIEVVGTLEEVREAIGVNLVAESEEGDAGFDSHLTMLVFMSLKVHQKFRDGIKSVTETI